MKKNILKITVFIASVALMLGACSKDNDEPGNPTNNKTTAVFNPKITYGRMTDQEGNIYKTVTIGTQTWMAENLRTTKYNDGTSIPKINISTEWSALNTGAYCNFKNIEDVDAIATFGRLYNWYAVNTGKLAPTGWHVPTDAELTTLITYLGSENVAGGKLKETGNTHWANPNNGATNEIGFTALPGGLCNVNGTYEDIQYYGYWWCSTGGANSSWCLDVSYLGNEVFISGKNKKSGLSVRCIKD